MTPQVPPSSQPPRRQGASTGTVTASIVVKFSRGRRQVRLASPTGDGMVETTLEVDAAAELSERIGHAVTAIRQGGLPAGVETALDLEL